MLKKEEEKQQWYVWDEKRWNVRDGIGNLMIYVFVSFVFISKGNFFWLFYYYVLSFFFFALLVLYNWRKRMINGEKRVRSKINSSCEWLPSKCDSKIYQIKLSQKPKFFMRFWFTFIFQFFFVAIKSNASPEMKAFIGHHRNVIKCIFCVFCILRFCDRLNKVIFCYFFFIFSSFCCCYYYYYERVNEI